ncbi:hypothetical protein-transmembrane prediction [Rhodopirellula baltica SH 1]|uniref:Uncharacterized protein n=1 Tax=Rhodopirellula baltica (strain DSM 10527 / NCIMB 13988 / SH1) TaxID=243090 RepID=Q7UUS5_RHOBA|nr:hypothetical protein-transmembrane prediction [Rhodopirellula baltica SH 1]
MSNQPDQQTARSKHTALPRSVRETDLTKCVFVMIGIVAFSMGSNFDPASLAFPPAFFAGRCMWNDHHTALPRRGMG